MGRPFSNELLELDATLAFAREIDVSPIAHFFNSLGSRPLVSVGVGGSFTAARLAAQVYEALGGLATVRTTLEFRTSKADLRHAGILIFTASGRNGDVLDALKHALEAEATAVLVVCARTGSQIAARARAHGWAKIFDFDLPGKGRDGFLATNSLLATCVLLARVGGADVGGLPSHSGESLAEQWLREGRSTLLALHGGWGTPAAVDLESKCSEAALIPVQACDYRHFAHGRHVWLAKRAPSSMVVAFVTPGEHELAARTLRLLPKEIPVLRLESEVADAGATVELLARVFALCATLGRAVGIDPGRPGVPRFGGRLYHLGPAPKRAARLDDAVVMRTACERKAAPGEAAGLAAQYKSFIRRLEETRFGAIVSDFDGTLCTSEKRTLGMAEELRKPLNDLLRGGVLLGIATGRGKSAHADLRKAIAEKYWERVLVGYYNGSQVLPLSGGLPETVRGISHVLRRFDRALREMHLVAKMELRPYQLTISDYKARGSVAAQVDALVGRDFPTLRLVHSSHSLDVVERQASKLRVVEACEAAVQGDTLCIGDRGDRAGNDFELLSTPFSLSVDRVSPLPQSCWNLAPPGVACVEAARFYLAGLKVVQGRAAFSLARSLAWQQRRAE